MGLGDLNPDDNETNSSTASGDQRRYVQPDINDFREFLDELDYEFRREPEARSTEIVFESAELAPSYNGVVLRLFSTIDHRTGKARSKGSDAIRCLVWDKHHGKPVGGRKKTLRIKTWRKNLREKIQSLMAEGDRVVEVCEECGRRMVIRDGKYGEFYSCTGYPDCDNTKDIE